LVIVFFAWGIVLAQGNAGHVWKIPRHSMIFLFLSAIATGLSWLFYYKALQIGEASRVAPIDKFSVALAVLMAFVFLGETPTLGNVLGTALVTSAPCSRFRCLAKLNPSRRWCSTRSGPWSIGGRPSSKKGPLGVKQKT
jgi:hypothetical protein